MSEVVTPPSFTAVAHEFSPLLHRYLVRQVGDVSHADDLVQETLLKIAQGLPGFAGRASLKTWVFTIANHVVTDFLRKPQQRARIVDVDEAATVEDTAPPLEARLIIDEMNHCVREVIDSLPPDYRSALILYDLEEMPLDQCAGVLDITPGAAKVRIHRARQRLREALQQSCGFYRDEQQVLRCTRKE